MSATHGVSSIEPASLAPGEVQVWHFALDADAATQAALARLLDEEERGQAQRFRFEEHRRRFIVRRGMLRLVLARFLGAAPETLRFARGALGKPAVAWPQATPLTFSTSSSAGLGAVAVAGGRELGLDVEHIRPDRDHDLIARQFAGAEAAALRDLPPALQAAAFFDLWTCKEAYLKGKGLGLSESLDQFAFAPVLPAPQCATATPLIMHVSGGARETGIREGLSAGPAHPFAPPHAPRLAWSMIEAADVERWSFYRLALAPGFAACLAVAGGCDKLYCRGFEGRS